MTFVAHVVEFLLIAGLLVGGLALAVAFLVARSYVRRHWRLVRGHVATRGVAGHRWPSPSAGRERYAAAGHARGAEPGRGGPGAASHVGRRRGRRDRRRPRRRRTTRRWPSCRRSAARCAASPASSTRCCGWSAACRAARAGPTRCGVQVAEVIGAARDVQAAALRAGGDATEPQVRALVRQARDEVDIVSTALSRMRSLAQPH